MLRKRAAAVTVVLAVFLAAGSAVATAQERDAAPTDTAVEQKTDRRADVRSDRVTDVPSDRVADRPTDRVSDRPSDRVADRPTDRVTDRPNWRRCYLWVIHHTDLRPSDDPRFWRHACHRLWWNHHNPV